LLATERLYHVQPKSWSCADGFRKDTNTRAIGADDARRRGKLIMARYRPQQRDRAQAKQARELAKAAAKKAEAANKIDKPTAAEVLKAAMERR
jgi:hypothetical protein